MFKYYLITVICLFFVIIIDERNTILTAPTLKADSKLHDDADGEPEPQPEGSAVMSGDLSHSESTTSETTIENELIETSIPDMEEHDKTKKPEIISKKETKQELQDTIPKKYELETLKDIPSDGKGKNSLVNQSQNTKNTEKENKQLPNNNSKPDASTEKNINPNTEISKVNKTNSILNNSASNDASKPKPVVPSIPDSSKVQDIKQNEPKTGKSEEIPIKSNDKTKTNTILPTKSESTNPQDVKTKTAEQDAVKAQNTEGAKSISDKPASEATPATEEKLKTKETQTKNDSPKAPEKESTIKDEKSIGKLPKDKTQPYLGTESKDKLPDAKPNEVVPNDLDKQDASKNKETPKIDKKDQDAISKGVVPSESDKQDSSKNKETPKLEKDATPNDAVPSEADKEDSSKNKVPQKMDEEEKVEKNEEQKTLDETNKDKGRPDFPEQEDNHFIAYFITAVVVFGLGYLLVHNKQKILAMIVEGRTGRRRRSHVYRKLSNEKSGNIF